MNCTKCKNQINSQRIKALPDTKVCVDCSTTEQVGCVDITYHKTGNTIQVMDKASADKINKLARRGNFGIMTGMKGGSGGATKSKITGSVKVWRLPTEEDYQVVLAKVGQMINVFGNDKETCLDYIHNQYDNKLISSNHTYNLRTVINALFPTTEPIFTVKEQVIDEEIQYAFKNWKNT